MKHLGGENKTADNIACSHSRFWRMSAWFNTMCEPCWTIYPVIRVLHSILLALSYIYMIHVPWNLSALTTGLTWDVLAPDYSVAQTHSLVGSIRTYVAEAPRRWLIDMIQYRKDDR